MALHPLKLGKYEIIEEIGRGGFGIVYRAVDTLMDSSVALKVLASHLLSDPQAVMRFRHVSESDLLFDHPNIVKFYEMGEEEGMIYSAHEYVSRSLKNLINATSAKLPITQIVKILLDCATGLDVLHQANIVHCNLKPSNILLDYKGCAKISDLGLAQINGQYLEDSESAQTHPGTPAYMSPEQEISNDPLTPTSDIFSMGCVLFEMLTRQPYKNMSAHSPIDWLRPDSPSWLNDLVVACLLPDIQDRVSNCSVIQDRIPGIERERIMALTDNHTLTVDSESTQHLRVFLCHASEDKPKVRELYTRLCSDGIDAWLDAEKILPGQDWNLEITRAVRASDIVVICFSKFATSKTGYVQKEIRFALEVADEQPPGAIFIVPLKLEECNIPDQLRHLQWTCLFEGNGYQRLLLALQLRAQTLKSQH